CFPGALTFPVYCSVARTRNPIVLNNLDRVQRTVAYTYIGWSSRWRTDTSLSLGRSRRLRPQGAGSRSRVADDPELDRCFIRWSSDPDSLTEMLEQRRRRIHDHAERIVRHAQTVAT